MQGKVFTGAGFENYPHVFPPPGFIPFLRAQTISVAAGAANSLDTTSLVSIPVQMSGWLVDLGVTIADTSVGSWSLYLNGAPSRDLTNLASSLGGSSTPVRIYRKLQPSQTVQLAFSNTGGTNMAASYYLFGWYYP